MLMLLCGINVQACAFHVEYNTTRDLAVDFYMFMFKLFHMFFLLCENNVQVCAFHVECNVTRDLTVDFLLYIQFFSTCIHM